MTYREFSEECLEEWELSLIKDFKSIPFEDNYEEIYDSTFESQSDTNMINDLGEYEKSDSINYSKKETSRPYKSFIKILNYIKNEFIDESPTYSRKEDLIDFFKEFIHFNLDKKEYYDKIKNTLNLEIIISKLSEIDNSISEEELISEEILDYLYQKLIYYEIDVNWLSTDYLEKKYNRLINIVSKIKLEKLILQAKRIDERKNMKDIRIKKSEKSDDL